MNISGCPCVCQMSDCVVIKQIKITLFLKANKIDKIECVCVVRCLLLIYTL